MVARQPDHIRRVNSPKNREFNRWGIHRFLNSCAKWRISVFFELNCLRHNGNYNYAE